MTDTAQLGAQVGTFTLAGRSVARLGFGAMRLTGPGIWGPPADRDECVAVVRRAVDLGVQLIDTADSYGPEVSEDIIREAIHPYPDDLVIATKAGLTRVGPNRWLPVARPEYLRQQALMSMRRLGVDHLDLFQLHRIDAKVPFEDQIGELKALRDEGKVTAVGLSQVSVEQIERARGIVEIASVQNRYNLTDRSSQDVLDYCTREGIGFIPWAPIAAGELAEGHTVLTEIADREKATAGQVALAWLLAISPVVLPIPGTSKVAHLEENLAAADVHLDAADIAALDAAVTG